MTKNRTSFEKDSNSEHAELFLAVRDYIKICIGNDVKERHNEHTTSFYSKEGGFCSIRVKEDYIFLSWFRGYIVKDKYNLLYGTGKVARKQKIYQLDKLTRESIRYYINETLMFLFEHNELIKMKCKKR
ncbi:hypothetical protein [uncultured Arcobacter sp.]|uniref:hypothetical protein n=1 Tax=uncultured Arcobacter sp. TaxID=165434 RepID=UPI00262B4949|nr:hypothetical protein [uncultured Arcobacter sp.]